MNPQIAAAQSLIAGLKAGGMSYAEIGRRVGRDVSYISQAAKGKKGGNLVDALTKITGGAAKTSVPRKQSKAGDIAKVRKGIEKVPGSDNVRYTTKTGDKTMCKALAQGGQKPVKWTIQFKSLKTMSEKVVDGWVSGGSSMRNRWTADKLLDRIQNPQPGDKWQPGEARKAMAEIAMRENSNAFSSFKGINEVQMYTVD